MATPPRFRGPDYSGRSRRPDHLPERRSSTTRRRFDAGAEFAAGPSMLPGDRRFVRRRIDDRIEDYTGILAREQQEAGVERPVPGWTAGSIRQGMQVSELVADEEQPQAAETGSWAWRVRDWLGESDRLAWALSTLRGHRYGPSPEDEADASRLLDILSGR